MSRRWCVALGLVVVTGCARDARAPEASVATWTVDSTPSLVIGRDAGETADLVFERITGATRLPDGQWLVADLGDAPLRLFAADGGFVRRIARKGGGPGEMEYLARLFRCGDAIYVFDIDGYRVSEYGTDATYRRTFRFLTPPDQQIPYVTACDADGRFAHLGWGAAPRVAGYHRDTVPVWITKTVDGAPTVVDSVPSSERWGQTYRGEIYGSMPLPLGKQPSIAYGPAGFYISTGDAFEVPVYDSTGTRLGVHRLADTVAAVTPDDVRDFIEAQIAEAGEQRRAAIEREHAEITFPARHGAITAMLVDAEGMLWLRPHVPSTAPSAAWRVLNGDGQEVARVALPRRLEVFEIGPDYVLGRQLDEEQGAPVVQVWRLRRTVER